ncbi:MAG: glycosyltransferase [Aldersonia sp.]|nr:glycosyltransferase [Aldersonia sp.]
MNILVWHVHGSWMTSFVQGRHRYLVPKLPEGAPWGLGRAGRRWPDNAVEVTPAELADIDVDAVVLQRPAELHLAGRWLGRRLGTEVPAVYVEHNAPHGPAAATRHPLADRTDIPIVHVTHFNRMMWDCGSAFTTVVPHGVVDPGPLYSGEIPHAATMINEPVRRTRVAGTDLLPTLATAAPIDVYGIGTELLAQGGGVVGHGDFGHDRLHAEVARRRVYVHTARWTSLGLSLIEAMHLGMPVVVVAATEAAVSIPPEAGVVSNDIDVLTEAVRQFVLEPGSAMIAGKAARHAALTNFGLDAFVANWDRLLAEVVR